jgi:ABC-type cobalamin transport system ATPase subunit
MNQTITRRGSTTGSATTARHFVLQSGATLQAIGVTFAGAQTTNGAGGIAFAGSCLGAFYQTQFINNKAYTSRQGAALHIQSGGGFFLGRCVRHNFYTDRQNAAATNAYT